MKIVQEDLVDWEPLRMRFLPAETFADPPSVVSDIRGWFEQNATKMQSDCELRFWTVTPNTSGYVEVFAEHLTMKALRRLTQHIAKRHPELDEVRIGDPVDGPVDAGTFDWVCLPASQVECGGVTHAVDPVAIAFTCVTLGQFSSFLEATSYAPVPDRLEEDGYLLDHFRLNYGRIPKLPLFGVTYDDALAYCEWAGLRLPTEPELHHFFVTLIRQGRTFPWSGHCWTATSPLADHFVVRNGPYREESLAEPFDRFRTVLHRHHYQELETPCFRVAKPLRQAN